MIKKVEILLVRLNCEWVQLVMDFCGKELFYVGRCNKIVRLSIESRLYEEWQGREEEKALTIPAVDQAIFVVEKILKIGLLGLFLGIMGGLMNWSLFWKWVIYSGQTTRDIIVLKLLIEVSLVLICMLFLFKLIEWNMRQVFKQIKLSMKLTSVPRSNNKNKRVLMAILAIVVDICLIVGQWFMGILFFDLMTDV